MLFAAIKVQLIEYNNVTEEIGHKTLNVQNSDENSLNACLSDLTTE